MGTVPDVTFKVEPWNANVGAKGKIEIAWFRIFGIPMEKRSNQRACMVASLVGLPLEVDKQNLKRWDFVRVKIGCRDVRKVPAVVEGLLEFYFYDFTFHREVPIEGITNAAGTKWTRNSDRHDDESPSPKKPKRGEDHKENQNRGQPSNNTSTEKNYEEEAAGNDAEEDHSEQLHLEKAPCEDIMEENLQDKTSHEPPAAECPIEKVTDKTDEDDAASSDHGLSFDDFISPGGEHFTFGSFQNVEVKNLWKVETGDDSSMMINEYGSNWFKSKSDPLIAVEAKQAILSGQHFPIETVIEDTQPQDSPMNEQLADAEEDSMGKVSIPSPYMSTQETVEGSSQEILSQETNAMGKYQPRQKQSDRILKQNNANIKIAEKAEAHLALKNLEGNSLSSNNSFAVLENIDITIKAGKLGIDSQSLTYERIDMLKELEKVRAGLIEKKDVNNDSINSLGMTSLPSEEMKLLEWYSENSDEDGFQLVSSRKSRKKKKSLLPRPKKKAGSVFPPPTEGETTVAEGKSKTSSGYNLREKRVQ